MKGRWWYRAQRAKCWVGWHNWNRLDTRAWRVIYSTDPTRYALAVCRVCFKVDIGTP